MSSPRTTPSESLPGRRWWRYGDRAVDRIMRLPPSVTGCTVNRGMKVPMRDGVELLADHYAPTTATPAGVILMRTPYGRGILSAMLFGRVYATRGYHFVVQSVRGTYGSGGTFEPITNEAADGADTVAWLRKQPWFPGRFATIGVSYSGGAQWAMLRDPPPDMAAAVIVVGPHDFGWFSWGTGAFALSDVFSWCYQVAHQEEVSRWTKLLRMFRASGELESAFAALPLGEAGRPLLGAVAPWYESWLQHPDRDDPFWRPTQYTDAVEKAELPVLLVAGWQDVFLHQSLDQYRRLRRRGVNVALTVGPWSHAMMLFTASGDVARETIQWLDRHLAGRSDVPARDRVRAFITNEGWVELPDWPPAITAQVWYLQPGGALTEKPPPPMAPVSHFRYEPWSPTPAVGGPFLASGGGYRDDSRLALRDDVLAFIGEPLESDLLVMGDPVVELWHSTDNPHVDVFVRVSEVDDRGRSRNVSDGYRRMTATSDPSLVRIELDPLAHRFRAGSKIRVLVAGGAFPRFSRNPGTGEPPMTARRVVASTHTVHHGERSRLILPIRSSADGAANPGGDAA